MRKTDENLKKMAIIEKQLQGLGFQTFPGKADAWYPKKYIVFFAVYQDLIGSVTFEYPSDDDPCPIRVKALFKIAGYFESPNVCMHTEGLEFSLYSYDKSFTMDNFMEGLQEIRRDVDWVGVSAVHSFLF